jgi:LmbE family N-acetylglucosaminyl deacetylase
MFKFLILFVVLEFLLFRPAISVGVPLNITEWKDNNTRVMVIVGHPDDCEGAMGGTIAELVAQGTSIRYLILTNGDKGCSNPVICDTNPPPTNAQLASIRQQEQLDAAKYIGISDPYNNVRMLGYEDSMLTSYNEAVVRQNIVQEIRLFKPHIVFSWNYIPAFELVPAGPIQWTDLGYHPDHQQSGKLSLDAQFDSQLDRLWPDSGAAWTVEQYYMFDFTSKLTHYVNITNTLGTKIGAYLKHASQNYGTQYMVEAVEFETSSVAKLTGDSSIVYAEGFRAYF